MDYTQWYVYLMVYMKQALPGYSSLYLLFPISAAVKNEAMSQQQTAFISFDRVLEAPARPRAVEPEVEGVLDGILAAVGLFVLAPLLVLIALVIRLDSNGPALYRDPHGAEWQEVPDLQVPHHDRAGDGAVVQQATQGDPRVTRIGRILRKPAWMSCRSSSM